MKTSKNIILFLALCFVKSNCIAQPPNNDSENTYRAIPWDIEQGLSIGSVNCMLKDVNGFLWIGTNAGLNRFDGSRFVNYFADKTKSGGIAGSCILSMVEDSLHNIWIGTRSGLSRFENRADSFINFHNYIDPNVVEPFTIPFWATSGEVFCIEMGSRITAYDIRSLKRRVIVEHFVHDWDGKQLRPGTSVLVEKTNSVWVLAIAGLSEISLSTGKQAEFSLRCRRKVKPDTYQHTSRAMCFDAKRNSIWINTSDGLCQFDLDIRQFRIPREFKDIVNAKTVNPHEYYYPLESIGLDREGKVWIGTRPKGILVYDPKRHLVTKPVIIDVRQNLSPPENPVYFDRDGIIWVSGGGVAFRQLNFVEPAVILYQSDWAKPFSLSHGWIATILQGPQNKLWLGTLDGINIFDPATGLFEVLRRKNLIGFEAAGIMPMAMDSSLTTTWLKGWFPESIYEMDIPTRRCREIRFADTAAENFFRKGSVAAESGKPYKNGLVFILQGLGIFRVAKGSFTAELMLPVAGGLHRMVIIEDSIIVLATTNGKFTYVEVNGKWTKKDSRFDSIPWKTIYFNKADQSYWIGVEKEIIHYDKNLDVIRRYADGFPGFDTKSLQADDHGNIWLVNGRSQISRLDPTSGKFLLLSEKTGLIKQNFQRDHPHQKDIYGNLYYGGSGKGLNRISPEKFVAVPHQSTVYVQSININKKRVTLPMAANYAEQLSLDHDENNISIETGIIDYYSEGTSRIRYKLEGLNEEWQYAANGATIGFDKLQPTKYRLILQASNAIDEFIGPEKILSITIRPPFWTTWWFRSIALLSFVAVIYGIIRWRLHQKFQAQLKASEKERQLAELRQQKTELEMQALRAQMNPHFIFNSLNSINRFILQNNKAQASEYLTKFSRLVRMILQNSSASWITLENELETLKLYLELESLRFENRFDYKISVPKDMDIDVLKVPPLIIQPYVENAIWHGLMHKEEKGHLSIDAEQKDDKLLLRITDNGIGRKQASQMASKSTVPHKSMGLKITSDRIAMQHRMNGAESPVTINDLVYPDGSAAGTEVQLKLPIQLD